jgi:predicted MFS family arabinose efflux permease
MAISDLGTESGIHKQTGGRSTSTSTARLWTAILAGVVGPEVFIVQPEVVQGFVRYLGFDEAGAGYAASVEVWGIAISTICLSFLAHRVNWRSAVVGSVLLMAAGNAGSALVADHGLFLLLRFLAGIGAGGLVSLSFAAVGMTSNPDRNFGYLIMWVLVYGAAGLWAVPTVYAVGGLKLLLYLFAVFPLAVLPFVRHFPESGDAAAPIDASAVELSARMKLLALVAMLLYFVAQGVVWAYLFLMGTAGGLSEQEVANALTLSQFAGVLGALFAGTTGTRIGRQSALTLGILGGSLCLLLLMGKTSYPTFSAVVCVYNFFWNMTHPTLLSAMAGFDRRGRVVLGATAMQMIGLAVGPALAAAVIPDGGYTRVICVSVAMFVLSWLSIRMPVRRHAALLGRTQ